MNAPFPAAPFRAAPFHDEPFPEVRGHASQVIVSADEQWIAVNSVWSGVSRVAVYRAADLSCAHLLTFTMDAESIAFHPTLPLLAIGLDNYDAYIREGGLTLLEPATGHRVDFADPAWGIEPIRWPDARTLELTFFTWESDCEQLHSRATVVRDDWLGLTPDALDLRTLPRTPLPRTPRSTTSTRNPPDRCSRRSPSARAGATTASAGSGPWPG
ncbi:hypothetical protein ACIBG6_21185 [Streptomyces sp. NPDC050842]|uniref:hypothetical protein n=1 Tax=Streptomyces sp. NPDC050842 TaxID=3365636 RepID=UPI00378F94B1